MEELKKKIEAEAIDCALNVKRPYDQNSIKKGFELGANFVISQPNDTLEAIKKLRDELEDDFLPYMRRVLIIDLLTQIINKAENNGNQNESPLC